MVQSLQDQIRHLQARLDLAPVAASHPNGESQHMPLAPNHSPLPLQQQESLLQTGNDKVNWPSDCLKEAEEVGVLAIGGSNLYSENKYGEELHHTAKYPLANRCLLRLVS